MKRQFNDFLKSIGKTILTMPNRNEIAKISTDFNNWMFERAQVRNIKVTEFANKFMIRKFIEKLV